MSGEMIAVERNLVALRPRCEALVAPVGLDPRRFEASLLLACEKNQTLLHFDPMHMQMAAYTAMTLGLEPDGITGQLYLIPFGINRAGRQTGKHPTIQPVTGYKGYNTMAARAGITILGDELREGDRFSTELVAGRPFAVERKFGDRQSAPVIGAWSQAMLPGGQYTTPVLMDMSEINTVRKRSAGAGKSDSPWNDRDGPGFAAMCAKTAKRRLQRALPMILTRGLEHLNISQHTLGMTMDQEHEDLGRASWIGSDHQVHHGPSLIDVEPYTPWCIASKAGTKLCRSSEEWTGKWKAALQLSTSAAGIDAALAANAEHFARLREAGHDGDVADIEEFAKTRKDEINGG